MSASRWDVIVSNSGSAIGVTVASENEALALSDVFSNSHTTVEIFEIHTETFQQASETVAKFLKGKLK